MCKTLEVTVCVRLTKKKLIFLRRDHLVAFNPYRLALGISPQTERILANYYIYLTTRKCKLVKQTYEARERDERGLAKMRKREWPQGKRSVDLLPLENEADFSRRSKEKVVRARNSGTIKPIRLIDRSASPGNMWDQNGGFRKLDIITVRGGGCFSTAEARK